MLVFETQNRKDINNQINESLKNAGIKFEMKSDNGIDILEVFWNEDESEKYSIVDEFIICTMPCTKGLYDVSVLMLRDLRIKALQKLNSVLNIRFS